MSSVDHTSDDVYREIGVAAIFMYQGFARRLGDARIDPYLVEPHTTEEERVRLIADLASEVAVETLDYIEAHPNIDYPGVFEYEVYDMSLGPWLAECFRDGRWPTAVEAVQFHHDVMDEWFEQLDEEALA